MITIRNMTPTDTFPKNEPFPLFGRMIPQYDGAHWTYTTAPVRRTSGIYICTRHCENAKAPHPT